MVIKIKARLFVDAPLGEGAPVAATQGQHHYLMHTLRAREGEKIALFNGRDGEWLAHVARADRKAVLLAVEKRLHAQSASPDIWLAFAPVKNEKIDFTARRAVELGVSALLPVLTRRTVVARVNEKRLRDNAIEAAEQCGRRDVPEVHATQPLEKLLGAWDASRTLLHCDEAGAGVAVKEMLPGLEKGKYAVLIGPEGGFAPEERKMLATLSFARGISLGPRILRAETAALAALANLMAWAGDWDEQPQFNG